MRLLPILIAVVALTAFAQTKKIDPFAGPKPIAVLLQTNPWLMVIGSDVPRVVIYEDGDVVYERTEREHRGEYLHKRLPSQELEDVRKKLAECGDFSKVQHSYDVAPNITDQPETRIYLNLDGNVNFASVYGWAAGENFTAVYSKEGGKPTDPLPAALRNLNNYLSSIHFEGADPWKPPYIEVMIWPYSYAPDPSIHWPKEWPGLESPSTFARGDSYSIFLPTSELVKLQAFLKTQKPKGAVELGGKKWAVSARYAFPSEPIWNRAFRSIHNMH